MSLISIVIPLAPGESSWKLLLKDISDYDNYFEIIFVTSEQSAVQLIETQGVRCIVSTPGRAEQMNTGARAANSEYLWFLHADSNVSISDLSVLIKKVESGFSDLMYFDLKFLKDATTLVRLNQWGANMRSRLFGIPFGDQGFCLKKSVFHKLGEFQEGLEYGEDHLFVWQAKHQRVRVLPIGAFISTSARKYKKYGWLRTTITHQYLWLKQAWPEWRRLKRTVS
jgi:hypothetical protein